MDGGLAGTKTPESDVERCHGGIELSTGFYMIEPPTEADRAEVASAGLCARCLHLQVLRSKTSTFVRCALSDQDEAFPRYPPLPVHSCRGYRPAAPP
jgi:hypothetical protein